MTSKNPARRDRLYLEEDADIGIIQEKQIASIGYGSQGHAQAQNLRDSGLKVIVGNQEDSYADKARADGLEVVPIAEAVKRADIILMLIPDEVQPPYTRPRLNRTHGKAMSWISPVVTPCISACSSHPRTSTSS